MDSAPDQLAVSMLEQASATLDITETQREKITQSYDSVGNAICEAEQMENCDPLIQPQGSVLLDTVVKPDSGNEFDVDATCLLHFNHSTTPSRAVYEKVFNALKEHGTYSSMCEHKNRCIRINYAGDYHLDMTPCVPNSQAELAIYVPDRDQERWKSSNPQLYGKFFNEVAKKRPIIAHEMLVVANSRDFSSRGHVEPLPAPEGFNKPLLKRLVQFLKRYRDVYFRDKDGTVISIIITTLAARSYGKLVASSTPYPNYLEFIVQVVRGMKNHIKIFEGPSGLPQFCVENPAIQTENFAEKWNRNPRLPQAFYEWHETAVKVIEEIRDAALNRQGNHILTNRIGKLHGTTIARQAAQSVAQETARKHKAGLITITSGLGIGSGAVAAPPTKYYGAEHE